MKITKRTLLVSVSSGVLVCVLYVCAKHAVRVSAALSFDYAATEVLLKPNPPSINSVDPLGVFRPPNAEYGTHGMFENELYPTQQSSSIARSIARRLRHFSAPTINNVNDWHFAMMNDRGRNTAFQNAVARAAARRAPQTVLEIGTGSGLLAMVAARLPQISHVFTIEANPDLAKLARKIVDLNRLSAKITVVPAVSTQVTVHTAGENKANENKGGAQLSGTIPGQQPGPWVQADMHHQPRHSTIPHKAQLLVAETIGTLLLSESQLDYVQDARARLCTEEVIIIPGGGRQYLTLFESPLFDQVTRASSWDGLDLSPMNSIREPFKMIFSKIWGFPLSQLRDLREMTAPLQVLDINFYNTSYSKLPAKRVFHLPVIHTGFIHGAFSHFELFEDGPCTLPMLSTHPERASFQQEMAWGTAVCAIGLEEALSQPLSVKKGQIVEVSVHYSRVNFGIEVRLI